MSKKRPIKASQLPNKPRYSSFVLPMPIVASRNNDGDTMADDILMCACVCANGTMADVDFRPRAKRGRREKPTEGIELTERGENFLR